MNILKKITERAVLIAFGIIFGFAIWMLIIAAACIGDVKKTGGENV